MAFCSVMDQELTTKGGKKSCPGCELCRGHPRESEEQVSHTHLCDMFQITLFLYASSSSDVRASFVIVHACVCDRLHVAP